jgi:hypothetical protein
MCPPPVDQTAVVERCVLSVVARREEPVSEDDPYADEDPAPSAPNPEGGSSSQGPPPGWEVIDEYGNPTGHDAYGNPVEPTPVEPMPQSEPPPGWEVIDEYGNPTGHDAYGNPVPPS